MWRSIAPVMLMVRNRLAQILNDKRLTQATLAKRCGIAPETIGRIKQHRRDPSAEVMLRIARALGMPVETIFYLDNEAPE